MDLGILDTPAEERFDRITRMAAAVLDVPMALITLVDRDRTWHKSRFGMDAEQVDRDVSFCTHAIVDPSGTGMVVADTTADPRFLDSPFVTDDAGIRFYAGHVLRGPHGLPLGTLCAVDLRPRELTAVQLQALADLGAMAEAELLRDAHDALVRKLDESERVKASILETLGEGLVLQSSSGTIIEWNQAAERVLGLTGEQLATGTGSPVLQAIKVDGGDWPPETWPYAQVLRTGEPVVGALMGLRRPDGATSWLQVSSRPTEGPNGEPRVLTVFVDITEKRSLEAALQASEAAARTSLHALEQGVMLVDAAATVSMFNPAAERLLGYTAAQLQDLWRSGEWLAYTEDWEPLRGDDRPLLRAAMGESIVGEVVGWIRRDGTRILIRMSCVVDADGGGGVLITFTDVTEERRMLRDLARFRYLFENADDMIAVIDTDGQVQYASPSTARVLGYDAGWQHPDGILGLVHPEDVPLAMQELERLIAGTRAPEPVTVRVAAASGEWRHVECVGVNLLDEPNVQGVVLTFRDTTERERLTDQLAHLATHDPLTDLANRSVLEPRLLRALARTARTGERLGLCFIDLDGFKAVNDELGHAAGDELLVEVARRIRNIVRTEDSAVRIGGDEFVVILDAVDDTTDAIEAATRIRDALVVPALGAGDHLVGASVGVAISEVGDDPAALLQRADTALYRAKAVRCSAVALAEPSLDGARSGH